MNTKQLWQFLTAIVLLFTVNTCKKSDDADGFPDLKGLYQASSTVELSALVMYTANGKITDQNIINAYLNRGDTLKRINFHMNVTSIAENNSGTRANFQNNGVVMLTDSLNKYSAKFTITQKNTYGFVLEAVDTTTYLENIQPYNQNPRSDMLSENIGTINRLSNCIAVPPQTGFVRNCTFRDAYQFIIKEKKIYYFSFAYVVSSYNNLYRGFQGYGDQPGYFNTGILNQLITGDTIVYQTHALLFSKIQ